MFEYQTVYNGYTALLAGLVSSVHCVAMCGPLSCAFGPRSKEDTSSEVNALAAYHGAKLLSYGIVGALAGCLGGAALGFLRDSWMGIIVPWVLVLFFVGVAFRLDQWLPKPTSMGKLYQASIRRFASRGRVLRAASIGLASPMLPCGPLYVIIGLCLFSGSAIRGAEFALGFGLGTLPLLWLAQAWFMRVQNGPNTKRMDRLRRTMALLAALVLIWRLRASLGLEGAVEWLCR